MGWDGLDDIDAIEPLDPADQAVIDAVRDVLEKHDALGRFGLTLLHSHFPLEEGELLVEEVDTEARTLTTRPMRPNPAVPGQSYQATAFRLDGPGARPITVMYCHRSGNMHAKSVKPEPAELTDLDPFFDACFAAIERGEELPPAPAQFGVERAAASAALTVHHLVSPSDAGALKVRCPDGSDGCTYKCRVVRGQHHCVIVCKC